MFQNSASERQLFLSRSLTHYNLLVSLFFSSFDFFVLNWLNVAWHTRRRKKERREVFQFNASNLSYGVSTRIVITVDACMQRDGHDYTFVIQHARPHLSTVRTYLFAEPKFVHVSVRLSVCLSVCLSLFLCAPSCAVRLKNSLESLLFKNRYL